MPVPLDHFLAFALSSLVLVAIPGPTIVMVVSEALAHGRRIALASVLGVALGDLLAASLSLVGVGTVLAASGLAFTLLKWLGAAYLVFIGLKMWRAPAPDFAPPETGSVQVASRRIFRDSFLVTLFNPKGIVFFMAFVPQFISAERAFAPQAAQLVATFVVIGMVNAFAYATLASGARRLVRRPRVLKAATRTGAGFLIGAGIASLFVRRAAAA
ncbi:lysine transporter LysE [Aureimonas endophytica]|uniref:Lysine transporter LysE n=1 Tax=Aureimonas endophytica TaxID=2027858 RepID=A0A917E2S8_9HYPH|nr:LysE family translocator [Aureimonas endophytica]GGD99470.1 lysine transporter LysE [Aureimonas endophytica]